MSLIKTIGRKKPINLDALDPVSRSAEEARRKANIEKTNRSRAKRDAKLAEQQEQQKRQEETSSQELLNRQQDVKQQELTKTLLQKYSPEEIDLWQHEEEVLWTLFHHALAVATGQPVAIEKYDVSEIASDQIDFSECCFKYRRIASEWQRFKQLFPILTIAERFERSKAGFHDDELFMGERKIEEKRKAQFAAGKLLSDRWFSMIDADQKLKKINAFLIANGVTDIWCPEESDTDQYGETRPWASWKWEWVESKPAPKPELPEVRPRSTTIPPEEALASNSVVQAEVSRQHLDEQVQHAINPLPLIEQALRERM